MEDYAGGLYNVNGQLLEISGPYADVIFLVGILLQFQKISENYIKSTFWVLFC